MTPSLETRDLTIRFGGHVAVDAVSCAFRPGELTAIVGPNGAGKTTYFNLMSGQLRATCGAVFVNGADVTALGAPQRARLGLGRAFQLTNLFPGLSVFENVRLATQARGRRALRDGAAVDARARDLIDTRRCDARRASASQRARPRAAALSHGDQRKLEVAMMMALEPASSCSTSRPPA